MGFSRQSTEVGCHFLFFFGCQFQKILQVSQNHPTSASSALLVGAQTWITVILNGLPWKRTKIILSFLRLHPSTAFLWGAGRGASLVKGKASACNARDLGWIPGSGRSPGEGNSNLLQYSCLENPIDREAWQTTVHGIAKSWTQLSDFTFFHFHCILDSLVDYDGYSISSKGFLPTVVDIMVI